MKKILYVAIESNQVCGGTTVMERNLSLLKTVPNVSVFEIRVPMQSKISALFSALTGGNLILSYKEEKKILKKITEGDYDYVFQEGTTSGHLASSISKTGAKLLVFGHNVETILYKERAETYKYNLLEQLKYYCVKKNEIKTIESAYKLITLTKRDSETFKIFFDRAADVIIPISSPLTKIKSLSQEEKYGIFVGSNFFPNNEGIEWFIKNVVPYINKKIKVIGSCCETITYLPENLKNKVEIMGLVDNIALEYERASFVIVPLFKGSGMKTKTIEAMSYGKTIFGTDEGFQGIDCDYDKMGSLCNSAETFIEKINNFEGALTNEYVLSLFNEKYSNDAIQESFNKLFK